MLWRWQAFVRWGDELRSTALVVTRLIAPGNGESKDTHKTPWFKRIWGDFDHSISDLVIDPFARNCRLGTHRNDLNPETQAEYNLDCLEFVKLFDKDKFDGCIFDPPFSERMAKDLYDEYGSRNLYCTHQQMIARSFKELERVIKPGGWLLKFGYNSSRPTPAFELDKIWIINKYGFRNDTIVTLWRHSQHSLDIRE